MTFWKRHYGDGSHVNDCQAEAHGERLTTGGQHTGMRGVTELFWVTITMVETGHFAVEKPVQLYATKNELFCVS